MYTEPVYGAIAESQYLELVYVASTCSQYIIIVSDTTWCQYMQQVHVASTLLLPRTVLRHWIPEFSVDDDSAGAGEVGAEEEQKGQEADEALSKQVQLAIADPEQRGKDEVRGRPQASPNALGTDKSDPDNLQCSYPQISMKLVAKLSITNPEISIKLVAQFSTT